jgi:hypothetical protein
MVCSNNGKRPLFLEERCAILGISLARAKFLVSCSYDDRGNARDGISSDRGQSVPYDEAVLVREAFRLGIGFADTARLMQMSHERLSSFGLPFPVRSKYPPPPGPKKIYSLFPPQPIEPNRCSK